MTLAARCCSNICFLGCGMQQSFHEVTSNVNNKIDRSMMHINHSTHMSLCCIEFLSWVSPITNQWMAGAMQPWAHCFHFIHLIWNPGCKQKIMGIVNNLVFVHVKWRLKQVAHSHGKGVVTAVDYMQGLREREKQRETGSGRTDTAGALR